MNSYIANEIKINFCLDLIKILYCSHNSECHCSQLYIYNINCFVCYPFVYTFCIDNNNYWIIVWLIFVTEIFKPRLLSSNTRHLHTRLTELLLTQLPALACLLYGKANSLMNVLEDECLLVRINEIFININIVVSLLLFVYFVYIYSCSICCWIFVYYLGNNYWTIVWLIFVTEIFKPRLLSSNTRHLHTRLTELLLTQLPALACLLYGKVNSLMNVLEDKCSWVRINEIFINVNIVFSLLLFVYFVYIYSCSICCWIFVYNLGNNYWTIVWLIFLTQIFKTRLLPSNTRHLHTRLTELLLTQLRALDCVLYGKFDECSWKWMLVGSL